MIIVKAITDTLYYANNVLEAFANKIGHLEFPINPFEILKEYNVDILFSNFDQLEGYLVYNDNEKSLVSINYNRPIQRQRFTAAHELGHIIMHTKLRTNFLCFINDIKNDLEKEADEFASYILMPNNELERQINKYQNEYGKVTLDDCLYIAEYFGVSFEACVRAVLYRMHRLNVYYSNTELKRVLKDYKPTTKRERLLLESNDINLLYNALNYSYFPIINFDSIIGIKFIQDLVYHESRLEKVDIAMEQIREIFADLRINGSNSEYCHSDNVNVIEALGNIELNEYCLKTSDKLSIKKIIDLNKKLYRYTPYPEYAGDIRNTNNIIIGGKIQPIEHNQIPIKMDELQIKIDELLNDIEKFTIKEYIFKSCQIHYEITMMHPFNNGNGRVARAFLNWLLRLKKLPPIIIDSTLRDDYLSALHAIDDGNDPELKQLQLIIIKSIINTIGNFYKNWN